MEIAVKEGQFRFPFSVFPFCRYIEHQGFFRLKVVISYKRDHSSVTGYYQVQIQLVRTGHPESGTDISFETPLVVCIVDNPELWRKTVGEIGAPIIADTRRKRQLFPRCKDILDMVAE